MIDRIASEPAALLGLATAVMAFLVGFGWVVLTPEQTGLVLAAITAALGLLRQLVTPTRKLPPA